MQSQGDTCIYIN